MNRSFRNFNLLIVIFWIIPSLCFSQNQKIADSLEKIYNQGTLVDTAKMELLRDLGFNELKDLQKGLMYAEELILMAEEQGNLLYLHRGYLQKGNKKIMLGDLEDALAAYFKSVEIANQIGYPHDAIYGAIADTYSVSGNHENAMIYYHKSIDGLRASGDSIGLASVLSNTGDEFLNRQQFDSALHYFEESEVIFEKVDYLSGKAYVLGNIGMVYANIGNNKLAESNIIEAIQILEKLEDYYPICVYLLYMSDIYLERGDDATALNYARRSLDLAQLRGLKDQISDANLKLSDLYEKSGNFGEAFSYYRNHIAYRDSLNNLGSIQKMADLRTDFEVAQKQTEVDLLNQQKRNQQTILISLIIILILGAIILGTLFWYYRNIQREKKRSESLLLNILPAETARELKSKGKVDAVKSDQVTVLFTDFVEFSKLAEHMEPEKLVRSIDFYFRGFDEIITKYGLEKIKTIGDSYMCASGIPIANENHATVMVRAAKEMVQLVEDAKKMKDGLPHFEVRIGIHSGPVVAGIVGIKKWQFDIWGDTVNIASRMESASIPGKVNISENTYQKVKNEFPCDYRGEIEVKNRGLFKMYFLS